MAVELGDMAGRCETPGFAFGSLCVVPTPPYLLAKLDFSSTIACWSPWCPRGLGHVTEGPGDILTFGIP